MAQLIIGAILGAAALGTDESWVRFLASTGAVVLTFLAGAELDPQVMKRAGTPDLLQFPNSGQGSEPARLAQPSWQKESWSNAIVL